MTKPSVIGFGYEFSPKTLSKVSLRIFLYSTSARGVIVEMMYAKLIKDIGEETLSFWGYGETNQLVAGSGLFVPREGVGYNHHFVLSVDKPAYVFQPGEYTIQIFAKLVTDRAAHKLYELKLSLTAENAAALENNNGVLFELEPTSQRGIAKLFESFVLCRPAA